MRLKVTGYYQGEYMYMLGNNGLIMNYIEYGVKRESIVQLISKVKYNMVYKPSRPYINKKGRLILGEGIKKRLKTKQKGEGLAAILGPIVKVASALFRSGKKRYGKKKQNRGKTRYTKTRKIT